MPGEIFEYDADGLSMRGELYRPAGNQPAPLILIYPEATGPGAHPRDSAAKLVDAGYAALVCDLYGGAQILPDMEAIMREVNALLQTPERLRARAVGAFEAATARLDTTRGIAAIGYCLGGTLALELARSGADIAATIGFHSGLETYKPAEPGSIRGKVLLLLGADDPGVPATQRNAFEDEMRAAGVDWRMHVYGGVLHGFTNPAADAAGQPDFLRYDAKAAERSWNEMIALLEEVFGSQAAHRPSQSSVA